MIGVGAFKRMLALCGYPQRFLSPKTSILTVSPAPSSPLTGTTSNTLVATDTIPAGALKVGSEVSVKVYATHTGAGGSAAVRIYLGDGTNTVQIQGWNVNSGTTMGIGENSVPLIGVKQQIAGTVVSPFGSYAYAAAVLDETKAWSVTYYLQPAAVGDTAQIVMRKVTITNP